MVLHHRCARVVRSAVPSPARGCRVVRGNELVHIGQAGAERFDKETGDQIGFCGPTLLGSCCCPALIAAYVSCCGAQERGRPYAS